MEQYEDENVPSPLIDEQEAPELPDSMDAGGLGEALECIPPTAPEPEVDPALCPVMKIVAPDGTVLVDERLSPIPAHVTQPIYKLQALRAIKRAGFKNLDWRTINAAEADVIKTAVPELSDFTYSYRTALYTEQVHSAAGNGRGRTYRSSTFLGWGYEFRKELPKGTPACYVDLLLQALSTYVKYEVRNDYPFFSDSQFKFARVAFKKEGSPKFSIRLSSECMPMYIQKYPVPEQRSFKFFNPTHRQLAFTANTLPKGGYTAYVQIIPMEHIIGLPPKV